MTPVERFLKLIHKTRTCWFWIGCLSGRGYGKFKLGNLMEAHRAAWLLFKGPIPNGMQVLHHCDTKQCVNPAHLFVGTQIDNMRDAISKGSYGGVENLLKTHCKRGHELSGHNLVSTGHGSRGCRRCRNMKNNIRRRKVYWAAKAAIRSGK